MCMWQLFVVPMILVTWLCFSTAKGELLWSHSWRFNSFLVSFQQLMVLSVSNFFSPMRSSKVSEISSAYIISLLCPAVLLRLKLQYSCAEEGSKTWVMSQQRERNITTHIHILTWRTKPCDQNRWWLALEQLLHISLNLQSIGITHFNVQLTIHNNNDRELSVLSKLWNWYEYSTSIELKKEHVIWESIQKLVKYTKFDGNWFKRKGVVHF